MFNKLKEVKDLRSQAKVVQNALGQITESGSAVGGKVTVVMNGNQEVQSVEIDKSLLSEDQQVKLQEGLTKAFNSAVDTIQKTMAKKVRSGELEMPDLSSLKTS